MPRTTLLVLLVVLGSSFRGSPARAENWPHWRGPDATGWSRESGLPVEWSAEENIAWKVELPARSGSTAIIWEDHLFLNVGQDEDLALWALDRRNGVILWQRPLGGRNRRMRKQNMSSPSPVTDGETVWVMTGTGVLKAFDFDGNEIWSREIEEDFGAFGLNWGFASSPLLHDGNLIVQVLHGMRTDDPSYVLSIDGSDGSTNWRVERPTDAIMESPDSYATPTVVLGAEGPEIVVSGANYVTGHEVSTGEELWRGGGLNPRNARNYRVVASPLVWADLIYVPTRVTPLLVYRAGGRGDITESHLAYAIESGGPDVPTPATDGERLYLLNDRGMLAAHDARSGELIWGGKRVAVGTYSASPLLAEGRI